MASFTITDLGTLGGTFSFARSLNNSGQVVGESQRADGIVHAFLWSTGIITDLGALAPGQSSFATAINDSGIITGYSGTSASTPPHAFLYGSGVMHDLGTLPGDIESEGYGVNSTSQVVGVSRTGSGTYLLIFNNGIYESTDASATSWTQEPLPSGGPHGVIALATGANVNGLVLDSGLGAPTLWRRLDRNTFVQIATGDYFPDFHDFYTFPPFVPGTGGGTTIVGNLGAPHGQPPTYAKSTDGGTVVQSLSFPASLQFLAGSTFVRFWADERTGANFLAQVRDPSGVDHLYASPDLQTWKPLALPTAPTVQAALLVAAALIGPVVAPTNWLPSQFNVGSQDNWLTAGAMYQEVINGSSLVMASRGSASITTTGGGNKQTTQFVCTKAIPGTDTAVTVFAVLFDSPGVTFAPGGAPSIVALGAGGADYTIPSAGTITQGGRSFLIAGQMANVFAPSPIPAGSVYQIQWTNKTPPGWTNATVLAMVLDVVGNYDILFGGLDNVSQGQNASPVTVDTGPTKPFVFTPPPPPYGMALQLMNVLTDGVPANLSVVGSNFTVPAGGTDPMGPQAVIRDIRGDFIRKQNGTYLVAVDLASGPPAIARSMDGVNWTFTTLPNAARPTPGLTECDDGTALVPSDGSAGPGLVFRTIDDGRSFQATLTPSGVIIANVGLKYFPGVDTLFAYVSKQAGSTTSPGTAVYLSTDQGQSWTSVFSSATSMPLPSQQSTSWMALTRGSTLWGVDSLTRANSPQGGFPSLYDALVSRKGAGRAPAFWGRYIGPKNGNLTQPEVDFLHGRNCKVLLIYNDTYVKFPLGDPHGQFRIFTYDDGVFHGTRAITDITTRHLTVPGGKRVWIYLDTETFHSPTADFFRGWSDIMLGSPYGGAGGVYGNTNPHLRGAQDFDTPYCLAYNSDSNMRVGSAPALLWANQRNLCDGASCHPLDLATNPPAFSPQLPTPCNPLTPPVVIYQYATQLTIATVKEMVDFDLANGAGFASMWGP